MVVGDPVVSGWRFMSGKNPLNVIAAEKNRDLIIFDARTSPNLGFSSPLPYHLRRTGTFARPMVWTFRLHER